MDRRLTYLAALITAPWLAVAGVVAVAYELLTQHRVWPVAAGGAALVVAFEVGVDAYRMLKTYPAVSRNEAVGRFRGRGWRFPGSGMWPPFGT